MNQPLVHPLTIICPHGGQAQTVIPADRPWSQPPIVLSNDVIGIPISCPLASNPCACVAQVNTGTAQGLIIDSDVPLLTSADIRTATGARCYVISGGPSFVLFAAGASGGATSPGGSRGASATTSDGVPASARRSGGPLRTERVALRVDALPGLPVAWIDRHLGKAITVAVTTVEKTDTWTVEQTVPLDGTRVSVPLDVHEHGEFWILAESHPGLNTIDGFSLEKSPPPFVGISKRTKRKKGSRRVSAYKDLSGSFKEPNCDTLLLANGCWNYPPRKQNFPEGVLIHIPIKVKRTEFPVLVLRPRYPRLLGLKVVLGELRSVRRRIADEIERWKLFPRADLARLYNGLRMVPAVDDVLARNEENELFTDLFLVALDQYECDRLPELIAAIREVRRALGDSDNAADPKDPFASLREELRLFFELSPHFPDAPAKPTRRAGRSEPTDQTARLLEVAAWTNEAAVLIRAMLEELARAIQIVSTFDLRHPEDSAGPIRETWDWEDWEHWYGQLHQELLAKEGRLRGREHRHLPVPLPQNPGDEPMGPKRVWETLGDSAAVKTELQKKAFHVELNQWRARFAENIVLDRSSLDWPTEPSRIDLRLQLVEESTSGKQTVVHFTQQTEESLVMATRDVRSSVGSSNPAYLRQIFRFRTLNLIFSAVVLTGWFTTVDDVQGRSTPRYVADAAEGMKLTGSVLEAGLDLSRAVQRLRYVKLLQAGKIAEAETRFARIAKLDKFGKTPSRVFKGLFILDFVIAGAKYSEGDYLGTTVSATSGVVGLLFWAGAIGFWPTVVIPIGLLALEWGLRTLDDAERFAPDLEELTGLIERSEFGTEYAFRDRRAKASWSTTELFEIPSQGMEIENALQVTRRTINRLPVRLHHAVVAFAGPTPRSPDQTLAACVVGFDPAWALQLQMPLRLSSEESGESTLSVAVNHRDEQGSLLTVVVEPAVEKGRRLYTFAEARQATRKASPLEKVVPGWLSTPASGTAKPNPRVYEDRHKNVFLVLPPGPCQPTRISGISIPATKKLFLVQLGRKSLGDMPEPELWFPSPNCGFDPACPFLTGMRRFEEAEVLHRAVASPVRLVLGMKPDEDVCVPTDHVATVRFGSNVPQGLANASIEYGVP